MKTLTKINDLKEIGSLFDHVSEPVGIKKKCSWEVIQKEKAAPKVQEPPPASPMQEDGIPEGDFSAIEAEFLRRDEESRRPKSAPKPEAQPVEPEPVVFASSVNKLVQSEDISTPAAMTEKSAKEMPAVTVEKSEPEKPAVSVKKSSRNTGLAAWNINPRCPNCGAPSVRGPYCKIHWAFFISSCIQFQNGGERSC